MSSMNEMTPIAAPSASRIGACATRMSIGLPSFRARVTTFWASASPPMTCLIRSRYSPRLSAGTCGPNRPITSSADQPSTFSAASFQKVTMPCASLPTTASGEALSTASSVQAAPLPTVAAEGPSGGLPPARVRATTMGASSAAG